MSRREITAVELEAGMFIANEPPRRVQQVRWLRGKQSGEVKRVVVLIEGDEEATVMKHDQTVYVTEQP